MKTKKTKTRSARRGFLMVDLAVAMSIFTLTVLPVAFSFVHETRLLRAEYQRAVANEIVDGEVEILAAGDWKHFSDGEQDYPVHLKAAANLPPGKFQLTKNGSHLRLEWRSEEHVGIGVVAREITVK
ncbi:MAG TPA: hypothetical protein VMD57_05405 [Candidatus Baltobacteraceae bacterium]|nr:hypothetical protein [Candidatus Baltobacteraceae bacterium]